MDSTMQNWRIDVPKAHPRLFGEEPAESFGRPGFQDGWRDVLERLCARIKATLKPDEIFEFVRIRQKFGLLRVEWKGSVSEETIARIEEVVALAEARSSCTCELCGAEGEKYHLSKRVMVRCEAHAEGRPLAEARANRRLHPVRVVEPPAPRMLTGRHYDRDSDSFVRPPEDM